MNQGISRQVGEWNCVERHEPGALGVSARSVASLYIPEASTGWCSLVGSGYLGVSEPKGRSSEVGLRVRGSGSFRDGMQTTRKIFSDSSFGHDGLFPVLYFPVTRLHLSYLTTNIFFCFSPKSVFVQKEKHGLSGRAEASFLFLACAIPLSRFIFSRQ